MNLTQVLHQQWAADGTLNGLLPASAVMTGRYFASQPTFPYACLSQIRQGAELRTNSGASLDTIIVEVRIWHGRDNYDAGKAIADAADSLFNRTDFALAGSDKILNMQRIERQAISNPDDGHWQFILRFECMAYLASGA